MRACVRACVRASVRACVCACVRACERACVRACVCVCVQNIAVTNNYSGNSRIVTAIADPEGMAFYLTDTAAARYGVSLGGPVGLDAGSTANKTTHVMVVGTLACV